MVTGVDLLYAVMHLQINMMEVQVVGVAEGGIGSNYGGTDAS